jgi:hypothetical protein
LNILKNQENFIKIRRPGDCMNFRETLGKIGRIGMSDKGSEIRAYMTVENVKKAVLSLISDVMRWKSGRHYVIIYKPFRHFYLC